jgi:hypothetical protein
VSGDRRRRENVPTESPAPTGTEGPAPVRRLNTGRQQADAEPLAPQDGPAEKAVLGACMLGADIAAVREHVAAEHFFFPIHGMIFDAICSLHAQGVNNPDPVLVRQRMDELGTLASLTRTNGDAYLHTLIEGVAIVGNAVYHAKAVRKKAGRRELGTAAIRVYQTALSGDDDDLAAVYEDAREVLRRAWENGGSTRNTGRQLAVRVASAAQVRSPRWLLDGRIPAAAITLLAGREGTGKSSAAASYAAQLTRGKLPGEYSGKPKSVVVYATEDSWESVIVPRMMAAGADLERVLHVDAMEADGRETLLSVPGDLGKLAEVCEEHDVALLILDPLMSTVAAGIDTHKEREVRSALDPLKVFAEDTRVAVLGLIHANKSTTTDPLNSIMGSRAFTAVARSVLYTVEDPEPEDGGENRYLLGHPKCNIGPKQPTERYHIISAHVAAEDGQEVSTSKIAWDGEDTRNVRDVLEAANEKRTEGGPAVRTAAKWLVEYLANVGGAAEASAVKEAGRAAEHSTSSVERASKLLRNKGTLTIEQSGFPARTHWMLEKITPT